MNRNENVQTLLLLGATGDLTRRWLLPGLGPLLAMEDDRALSLIGSGTEVWDDARWRGHLADSFENAGARGSAINAVLRSARYIPADATNAGDLRRLLAASDRDLILYFALPPHVTRRACELLADITVPAGTRLVLEKPFGTSAQSAQALNDLLARIVPEEQVYRVDHYLGMHTVLNIIGLRFANRLIEPLLTSEHVQCIEITSEEPLGVAGRARYYDRAGALVDVTQSHLLLLLALVAMEPPAQLTARDLHACLAQVLRATHVWEDDPVAWSRRGRYTAGTANGRRLASYVDEDGVDPARNTETFAEVVLEVDTWRWAGVPFYVRTGKALRALRNSIVITFKDPSWIPPGLLGYERANRLVIGIDPPKLQIDLNINGPADRHVIDPVTLDTAFGPGDLPPYGEILKEIFDRDQTLSVRGDIAVESWKVVEPVLAAWRRGLVPLQDYAAGSHGPAEWPTRSRRSETVATGFGA